MQPATNSCPEAVYPARLDGNEILLLGASDLSDHLPCKCNDDNASARRTVMLWAPAEAEVAIEGRPPSALPVDGEFADAVL